MPESRLPGRLRGALAALSAVALAGCGSLTVSVEQEGAPLSVSVRDARQSPPPEEPEPPEGTVMRGITTPECRVPLSMPLPESWGAPNSYDNLAIYGRQEAARSAGMYLTCERRQFESINTDVVRGFFMDDEAYEIVSERRGTTQDVAYWIYVADTTGAESTFLSGPARSYGLVANPRHDGTVHDVRIELKTLAANTEEAELFAQIMEFVEINGVTFDLPQAPPPGG
ncbi:hypothetical protein [Sediminivirga luteola]|uniref:hypothetical protein n=1 Tax=Sediminivirga luteola TaxID=1774748 RepID=UPI001F588E7D|nr:hypothetical protein [Sediminivirga luteola]MCI2264450.1 hypothetical protein [Sediminivirga luteola]